MVKKLRLKERAENHGDLSMVDIRYHMWANAYIALKSYYIYCLYCNEIGNKSVWVQSKFIHELENGLYDKKYKKLKRILKHPNKGELQLIATVNFISLIKSNPVLLAGAFLDC